MTLDLTRPEHRSRVEWAATFLRDEPRRAADALWTWDNYGAPLVHAPDHVVLRALSSPSDSAAIVRTLLESLLGAVVLAAPGTPSDPVSIVIAPCLVVRRQWLGDVVDMAPVFTVYLDAIPALILRLLACTTKEEALAALRGAA